ncbi:MAG TPA: ATP-binding protein, partial [Vicinamibacterales bacterium]
RTAAERMQRGELGVQVEVRGRDEIAELGQAFNSMASRLAETERLRRQMVSDVAHELRSPVTNLRCTLEAIQDGLAPLDRAGIDALHEETLFLQRLVADLQDLAVAEAGGLGLNATDVDILAIVRRAAGALSDATGAPITIDVPPGLPRIRGDADRLEQVLRNLLSNARRHTPADGTITVTASADAEQLRITVRDTGAGIAAEHLPHVFDRFYRADQSRARDRRRRAGACDRATAGRGARRLDRGRQ